MPGLADRRPWRWLGLVALAPMAWSSCDDNGAVETVRSEHVGGFVSLLGTVPADLLPPDSPTSIVFGDLDAVSQAARRTRPPAGDDDHEALSDWYRALMPVPGVRGSNVAVQVPSLLAGWIGDDAGEITAEMGWSLGEVRRFVEFESDDRAEAVFQVLDLVVDGSAITAAAGEPADGVWVIGDEDAVDSRPTPLRPAGRPLWMAMRGSAVAVARTSAPVATWAAGAGASLADDPSIGPIAQRLDAAGAYAAFIVEPVSFADAYRRARPRTTDDELAQLMDEWPIPNTHERVGVGLHVDGVGDPAATFVYVHEDADAAAAAAPVLRRVFEEGTSLKDHRPLAPEWGAVAVSVDERLVVVEVSGLSSPQSIQAFVGHEDTVVSMR